MLDEISANRSSFLYRDQPTQINSITGIKIIAARATKQIVAFGIGTSDNTYKNSRHIGHELPLFEFYISFAYLLST